MGSRPGQRASKSACFIVPPLFRADSRTNLIKQGENVIGRPSGPVAQLAECSHGKREVRDVFLPCEILRYHRVQSRGPDPPTHTHTGHQMSQVRKKSRPDQGLSLIVRALCQLSYRATWSSYDMSNHYIQSNKTGNSTRSSALLYIFL